MFGFCMKDSYICLVTEYVRGGNLQEAMSKRRFNRNLIVDLSLSIFSGMIFLNSKKIIHRDLKPANILVALDPFLS